MDTVQQLRWHASRGSPVQVRSVKRPIIHKAAGSWGTGLVCQNLLIRLIAIGNLAASNTVFRKAKSEPRCFNGAGQTNKRLCQETDTPCTQQHGRDLSIAGWRRRNEKALVRASFQHRSKLAARAKHMTAPHQIDTCKAWQFLHAASCRTQVLERKLHLQDLDDVVRPLAGVNSGLLEVPSCSRARKCHQQHCCDCTDARHDCDSIENRLWKRVLLILLRCADDAPASHAYLARNKPYISKKCLHAVFTSARRLAHLMAGPKTVSKRFG